MIEEIHEDGLARRIRDAVEENAVQQGDELSVGRAPGQKLWRVEEYLDRGEDRPCLLELRHEALQARLIRPASQDADVESRHEGGERIERRQEAGLAGQLGRVDEDVEEVVKQKARCY